ncbi:MAG: TolC family protein [Phycisphaerales bacterium]|nr:TolC family protein [Phycisphaerales bacterium]
MQKRIKWIHLAFVSIAWVSGCAKVDPSADYRRVAERVKDATGRDEVYHPDEDDLIAAKVADLLRDGLTVDEAVQISLLNNPRLQAAFWNIGMARADVVQSGLLSNPTLGLSFRLPSGGGLANFEAGIVQNIADLWQIPVRKRAAEQTLNAVILKLARQVGVNAMNAKSAYFEAQAADRQREIALENLELSKQLLGLTTTRRQAGAGNEIEVNLSRAELLETELAVRTAEQNAYTARRNLTILLGLSIPLTDLVLTESLPNPIAFSLQEDRVFSLAQQYRPDLLAAEASVESALAAYKQEVLRIFPTLNVGLALERMERGPSNGRDRLAESVRNTAQAGAISGPDVRFDEDKNTDLILGPSIGLQLPIFDQNQAQIARAAYAHKQAAKSLEAMKQQITQDARLAIENARIALDMAGFFHSELLPLRQQNLDLTREAFRAGRTPLAIVLDAQRALIAARGRYIEQTKEAAVALVELEKVVALPLTQILSANTDQAFENTDPVDEQPHAGAES